MNCSAHLTWYFATKEKDHGIETNPEIPRLDNADRDGPMQTDALDRPAEKGLGRLRIPPKILLYVLGQFWSELLHPAVHRGAVNCNCALPQQIDNILKGQRIPQIPKHRT